MTHVSTVHPTQTINSTHFFSFSCIRPLTAVVKFIVYESVLNEQQLYNTDFLEQLQQKKEYIITTKSSKTIHFTA